MNSNNNDNSDNTINTNPDPIPLEDIQSIVTIDSKEQAKEKTEDKNKNRKDSNFTISKSIFIPFFSGIVGSTLILGITFGIPSIRSQLLNTNNPNELSTTNSTSQLNTETVIQTATTDYSDNTVFAANKVLPSIVGITVEYNFNNNTFNLANSQISTATGSGIILSEDGYILTNNHIVSSTDSYYKMSEATKITVKLYNDDKEYEAIIIGKDEQTDLAVLKIETTGLTPAEFGDSDQIKVGEFAMAVGNPLGLESSVTTGIISGINREVTDSTGLNFTVIQTDAAINSGNSGGALVNSSGQVIGINTLKLSGTGIEGVGFAIPINSTISITEDLIEFGEVKRPYIGISGIDLDEQTAEDNNLPLGIYVKTVDTFSAAERASIKVGDVIVGINGTEISTMDELNNVKNTFNIGDEITLSIIRNDQELELTVILGENSE